MTTTVTRRQVGGTTSTYLVHHRGARCAFRYDEASLDDDGAEAGLPSRYIRFDHHGSWPGA